MRSLGGIGLPLPRNYSDSTERIITWSIFIPYNYGAEQEWSIFRRSSSSSLQHHIPTTPWAELDRRTQVTSSTETVINKYHPEYEVGAKIDSKTHSPPEETCEAHWAWRHFKTLGISLATLSIKQKGSQGSEREILRTLNSFPLRFHLCEANRLC